MYMDYAPQVFIALLAVIALKFIVQLIYIIIKLKSNKKHMSLDNSLNDDCDNTNTIINNNNNGIWKIISLLINGIKIRTWLRKLNK